MSTSIYTHTLNENLSNMLGTRTHYIPELSDQSIKEQVQKLDKLNQEFWPDPWNKGKKGLQVCWSKGKKIGPNVKLSEYRSGKTYEELYGNDEAKKQRELRSNQNSGSGNPMWNKHHTEETKQLIGKLATGRKTGRTAETFTDDWKHNISKGVANQKQHTCPHCSKTMAAGNYTRWHGDNCKRKK